jgi:catechol 2,3-dioxygenase-like lactoylglutathione lyase family enzyme
MIDHFGVQCTDLPASSAFYDQVLGTLGFSRQMDFGLAIGYGEESRPQFWISGFDPSASPGSDGFRESHIAFTSPDRASVRAFFAAATGLGAEMLHEPRLWPEYHATYYAAFVRDPDGHNVEAVCHLPED